MSIDRSLSHGFASLSSFSSSLPVSLPCSLNLLVLTSDGRSEVLFVSGAGTTSAPRRRQGAVVVGGIEYGRELPCSSSVSAPVSVLLPLLLALATRGAGASEAKRAAEHRRRFLKLGGGEIRDRRKNVSFSFRFCEKKSLHINPPLKQREEAAAEEGGQKISFPSVVFSPFSSSRCAYPQL